MKFKSINKHIVNGSTLMGFGITILFLSKEIINDHNIIGIWGLGGGIWFSLLGLYELFISVVSKKFFE